MTVNKVRRKLTTIFCADVQSYSSLMSGDEADTLQRLQRYRSIMTNLFDRHEGRKVNTWGDAVIAEFSSVVEAVRCGVEIQDAIGAENRDLPFEKQMWFRIGINLGDVMEDGGDLYGDGVNVAARLESIAEPGGIMVSDTVFNLTHKQLAIGYEFVGEHQVKGHESPILGYRVRMPASDAPIKAGDVAATRAKSGETRTRSTRIATGRLQKLQGWFGRQPKSVRLAMGMIALFATINVSTNGLREVWFIYPSLPFALYLFVRGWRQA